LTTFVLVAGAWHGAWCWYKVAPLLEAGGHTVVSVDLPSLGRDTTPISEVSLAMWRDHVVNIIDAQSDRVVLVGHSRAGVVISEVAEQRPERIESLVFVAAFLPTNGSSVFDLSAAGEETVLTRNSYPSDDGTTFLLTDEGLRPSLYGECSDEDVALARSLVRPEAVAPSRTAVTISDDQFGSVPRDYVECLRDNAIALSHQRRMQADQPCRRVAALDTDHSPFFSEPQRLVEFISGAVAGN
jgi:pimeloyl-ACP methyl ester carboxylesterase